MDSVEASGKSIDDAILQALARLGRRRDEVEVAVLQEPSRGNRGVGVRDARVRVWMKRSVAQPISQRTPSIGSGAVLTPDMAQQWLGTMDDDDAEDDIPAYTPPVSQPVQRSPSIFQSVPVPVATSQTQRQPVVAPDEEDDYADDDDYEDEEDGDEALIVNTAPTLVAAPSRPRQPIPDLSVLEAEDIDAHTVQGAAPDRIVRQATDILREILHHMELPAAVELASRNPLTLNVRMGGDHDAQSLLIGRRGETLSSLQLLVNLILNRKSKERYHVLVDVEHYRSHRDENLRSLALRIAQQVQQSQRSMTMEPMTPYERRIVHLALQESPVVQTQSTGDGEQRRVVISLKHRSPR